MPKCEMCQAANPHMKGLQAAPSGAMGPLSTGTATASAASVFKGGAVQQRTLRELYASRRGDMASIGDQLLHPLLRIASHAVNDAVLFRVMLVLTSFVHYCPCHVLRGLLATFGHDLPSVVACKYSSRVCAGLRPCAYRPVRL